MKAITFIKFITAFFLTVVASSQWTAASSNAVLGDSAYNKKDYTCALDFYTAALKTEKPSSNLYYNLGNTYYRLNDPGHAILNYERALAHDPSNKDARTNLKFVKSKIINAPQDDSSFLGNLHNDIVSWFSPDTWAWLALGLFAVLAAAIALYVFAYNVGARKTGFFGAFVVAVIFAYVLTVAIDAGTRVSDHDRAVVTGSGAVLQSAPAAGTSKEDKIIPIPQGTGLEIVDSVDNAGNTQKVWYEVKLNNTTRAWIEGVFIERI